MIAHPSIEVMTDAVVTGRFDHNWVPIVQRDLSHVEERLVTARAKTLVVAAGILERPYVFRGNDLPGVMFASAAQRQRWHQVFSGPVQAALEQLPARGVQVRVASTGDDW